MAAVSGRVDPGDEADAGHPETDSPDTDAEGGPTSPGTTSRRRPRRVDRAGTGTPGDAVQRSQTGDDTDAGWGERADEGTHERWLHEQRPPHWD
jgi:hypothetical protein